MPRKASPAGHPSSASDDSKPKSTEHLGKTLLRLRKKRGLTQEGLAKEAGMSRTGLALIERGVERNVRLTTLDLLAKRLSVDVVDLLAGTGQEPVADSAAITAEVPEAKPGEEQSATEESEAEPDEEQFPCSQEYFIRAACNIARYRKLAKLTQEELSALAHRYRTFVSSIEQLHALPTIVGLEALTEPLGVSVLDLLAPVTEDEYEERRARLPRSRRLRKEQKLAAEKLEKKQAQK